MTERLVWIDCEMTGLDEVRDELIEVAAVVTDFD
ncbi:MAG: exonuclease domain-containing protein, partial [Stackebrandtia sp.]